MEQAVVMMTGLSSQRVLQALAILDERRIGNAPPPRLPPDHAIPDVSAKVVAIILSYTDYVRRTIWKNY